MLENLDSLFSDAGGILVSFGLFFLLASFCITITILITIPEEKFGKFDAKVTLRCVDSIVVSIDYTAQLLIEYFFLVDVEGRPFLYR